MEIEIPVVGDNMTTASLPGVSVLSVVKACLLGVVVVLILLGNSLCLAVLRLTPDGVSPVTKLFLVSLTTSDLLVGLLVGAPAVGSTALRRWPYGDAYCTLIALCHVLYFNAGLSVLAINIERYIAVIWPLRYPSIVTLRRAFIAEAFFLAALLAWGLLYVLLPERSAFYYPNFSVCFIDADQGHDVMGQLGMSLFIAGPVFITFILHVRLCCLAAHHASRVDAITIGGISATGGNGDASEQQNQPSEDRERQRTSSLRQVTPESKAARTFFIMALVAAVSWTPYYVVISWENFRQEPAPDALAFMSQLSLLLNSLWNVVIYYARNRAFRNTANRLLGCRRGGRAHQSWREPRV